MADEKGVPVAGQEDTMEVDLAARLTPKGYVIAANPKDHKVAISYLIPGAIVAVEMTADEKFERLLDELKKAYLKARSGLITPSGRMKGIVGS